MLALDDPTDTDEVFTEGRYSFCIDKELLKQVKDVTVDFTYMGFSVEPGVPLSGGGGCGSGGGCSGCGSA